MADLKQNFKSVLMKGMETIGNTATSIAVNTKFKVQEMNLVNKRREILNDFGAKAYALWQKGSHFPEELEEQLSTLAKLDEELNDLRAEHLAGVKTETAADEDAQQAERAPVIEVETETEEKSQREPLSDAINDLFDGKKKS